MVIRQSSSVLIGLSLGLVSALRIFGLMVVVPVLGLHAHKYATDAVGIGWAIGIYGLMQAIFQIPLGWCSDQIGRKPVIIIALLIFAGASFAQVFADDITTLILLRAIQGAAAINGVISAYAMDLAPKAGRPLVLGMIGMMIGIAFFCAMILGPILNHAYDISGIFMIVGALVSLSVLWVVCVLPKVKPATQSWSWTVWIEKPFVLAASAGAVIHGVFTVVFSVLPLYLLRYYSESTMVYQVYAPSLLCAMVLALMVMRRIGRERPEQWIMASFIIMILGIVCIPISVLLGLLMFVGGFTVLEATLPVFLVDAVPSAQRGVLMGGYFSCIQLGVFLVSLCAGYVRKYFGWYVVMGMNACVMLIWLCIWGLYLWSKKCHIDESK